MNALPYPPYIVFTFENQGAVGDQPVHELLRVLVRTDDGVAVMTVIRDFRGNTLSTPRATVVSKKLDFLNVSNVLRLGDFPLADFGLRYVRPARPDFFDSDPTAATGAATAATAATPNLKVIATVGAGAGQQYHVADPGIVEIDGKPAYHFAVTPVRNSKHNTLREIWIDTTTNLPVRYIAQRFIENYPGDDYSYYIAVDAREIDGHLVNVDADGSSLLRGLLGKWQISDVSFPASEPDWVFDRDQWKLHIGEPIPNLAPSQPFR
ncbi:MAG TPA: hypothetical protein VGK84_04035 [Candidatus Tumulicola sp.]